MPPDFVQPHPGADGAFFYAEKPAEAAALVFALGLYDLDAVFQFQQIADFVEWSHVLFAGRRKSQLPHSVAGVVDADFVREAARQLRRAQNVVEEFHYVHTGSRQVAFVAQQLGVVHSHKGGAADARGHDIVVSGK